MSTDEFLGESAVISAADGLRWTVKFHWGKEVILLKGPGLGYKYRMLKEADKDY